jgi:hypothetical protein
LKYFKDVVPERNRVDISFEDWAIELKTVNTNYRFKNVEKKTRPITKNIKGVINDIEKLKALEYTNKSVMFVVFPLTLDNKDWLTHLEKIKEQLIKLKYIEFYFKGKIPGVLYFGLV